MYYDYTNCECNRDDVGFFVVVGIIIGAVTRMSKIINTTYVHES